MLGNVLEVFAANAFALLGLQALYFSFNLRDFQKLIYLSLGLSLIPSCFIGVKLILTYLHEVVFAEIPKIPTVESLGVIAGILIVTVVASLAKANRILLQKSTQDEVTKTEEEVER